MEIEITVKGELTKRERDLLAGLESYLSCFLFIDPKTSVDTPGKISETWGMTWQTPPAE